MQQPLTLQQLALLIKGSISNEFPEPVWITAEINDVRVNQSGHCYLELIEKDQLSEKIISSVRAIIWSFQYRIIKPYFETSTGISIIPGIKILIRAQVEFHMVYGLSLSVIDIDPAYTIGEVEMRRQQIIKKLTEDGIVNLNRELEIPLVCQRIAIISSKTAAGYEDFVNQLEHNKSRITFYCKLFNAVMQGENAEESIISALEKVYRYSEHFDVVVIIRGGGARTDLSCFDSYMMASHIAQFVLPVITGIGHERDETIADLVAWKSLKTPTAVAEFLIEHAETFLYEIEESFRRVKLVTGETIKHNKHQLNILSKLFIPDVRRIIEKNQHNLSFHTARFENITKSALYKKHQYIRDITNTLRGLTQTGIIGANQVTYILKSRFVTAIKKYLAQKKYFLTMAEQSARLQDPDHIISKGYSVVYKDGKIIRSVKQVVKGDIITNKLKDGDINSKTL